MEQPAAERKRPPIAQLAQQFQGWATYESVLDFLDSLEFEQGRSRNTVSAYRRDLVQYLLFLKEQGLQRRDNPEWVKPRTLEELPAWCGTLGYSATSINRFLSSVRSFHRWVSTKNDFERGADKVANPTALLSPVAAPDALPKALTVEQVTSLIEVIQESAVSEHPTLFPKSASEADRYGLVLRDKSVIETLYSTGARVSEFCGLSFGDVDTESMLIRLYGKGSKERIVPIGPHAIRALEQWLMEGRPVLTQRSAHAEDALYVGLRGKRIGRQEVWSVLQKWSALIGLQHVMTPHVLRHSCATHLLEGGADIRIVQEFLGHSSVATTQRYTKITNEHLFAEFRQAHPRAQQRPSIRGVS